VSEPSEQKVPKGSYAAGRRVRLPRGASEPIVETGDVQFTRDGRTELASELEVFE
jgi:hypothetical protein